MYFETLNFANMGNLKVFRFSGFGNYSDAFSWDQGLSSGLDGEVSVEDAHVEEEEAVEYSSAFNTRCLPDPLHPGVFTYFSNCHGGSRDVRGFVVAWNRTMAEKLLRKFDASYEVVEYERD